MLFAYVYMVCDQYHLIPLSSESLCFIRIKRVCIDARFVGLKTLIAHLKYFYVPTIFAVLSKSGFCPVT